MDQSPPQLMALAPHNPLTLRPRSSSGCANPRQQGTASGFPLSPPFLMIALELEVGGGRLGRGKAPQLAAYLQPGSNFLPPLAQQAYVYVKCRELQQRPALLSAPRPPCPVFLCHLSKEIFFSSNAET